MNVLCLISLEESLLSVGPINYQDQLQRKFTCINKYIIHHYNLQNVEKSQNPLTALKQMERTATTSVPDHVLHQKI